VKDAVLVALAFLLLVVQATVATIVPTHVIAPNLLLPIAIYLGVSHDVWIVRGALLSFVFGAFLDAFSGNPVLSLQTFAMVAVFVLSRFAGLRLFLRGPIFQIILTFVVTLLAGGTILALRTIFEKPAPFPVDTSSHTVLTLVAPALTTAIVAPLIFLTVRRVDSAVARRRDQERTA
jgi:rod shape-determining protein MreD